MIGEGRGPSCATCEAVDRHPHLRCEDHPFAGRGPSSGRRCDDCGNEGIIGPHYCQASGCLATAPASIKAMERAAYADEDERTCPAREGENRCGTPRPCPVHMPYQYEGRVFS